jgi:hypothetical protein
LVSVHVHAEEGWSAPAFEAACSTIIEQSLLTLRQSPHTHAERIWNFVPGICRVIGNGLDRYRVFNMARHRVFAGMFGESAIGLGMLPTASCVGHQGLTLSTHVLGLAASGRAIENARQIPAFAYSTRFGPRPPCFSRARLVEVNGERLLMVAGTASVRGEDSVHHDSLEAQLRETLINLRAVVSQGRAMARSTSAGEAESAIGEPLSVIRSTRVYYRRPEDRGELERALPHELGVPADVEYLLADICRDELLVEIELLADCS